MRALLSPRNDYLRRKTDIFWNKFPKISLKSAKQGFGLCGNAARKWVQKNIFRNPLFR
jgi:hypothetical protein